MFLLSAQFISHLRCTYSPMHLHLGYEAFTFSFCELRKEWRKGRRKYCVCTCCGTPAPISEIPSAPRRSVFGRGIMYRKCIKWIRMCDKIHFIGLEMDKSPHEIVRLVCSVPFVLECGETGKWQECANKHLFAIKFYAFLNFHSDWFDSENSLSKWNLSQSLLNKKYSE